MRTLVELTRGEVADILRRVVARRQPGLVVGSFLAPAENFFFVVGNRTGSGKSKGGKRK